MKHTKTLAMSLSALLMLTACNTAVPTPNKFVLEEAPITFEAKSGEKVDALEGTFLVPENRSNPDSRMLTLHYVKFPSTSPNPGAPIIYLAGGPGGSGIGTAKGPRYPLFMAMREFGDVIAFDQRGTGASDVAPRCESSQVVKPTDPISPSQYLDKEVKALTECLSFWTKEGIDIHGYTTPESVNDLDDLRKHLGAEKISLWGTSYGSHLSLAAMKQIDSRLDKIVMSSAEGLDQTIKLPARTDDYFDRLQAAVNSQAAAKAMLPDIKTMIRRVNTKLDHEPLALQIPQQEGAPIDYLVTRLEMQQISSMMISDPKWARLLLQVYGAMDQGVSEPMVELLKFWYRPGNDAISYKPMGILMDIASGTGADRRAMIEMQAQTSMLGHNLNHHVRLEDIDPSLNLGDEFRKKPVSDTPVLLLSGTLDGRTYIESQREAISGLSNAQAVTVTNAGHNLFMSSPKVTETIQDFMRGENVSGREIVVELPNFLESSSP